MAETFTYDFISFLRLLYRQRYFIISGTVITTLLVAIASLIWPQTWRGQARVLVTTPQYKEELNLVAKPFDVLAYQALLMDDGLLQQVRDTLVNLKQTISQLYEPTALSQLDAYHADRPQPISRHEMVQHTRPEVLMQLLGMTPPEGADEIPLTVQVLSQMGGDEIRVIDEASLADFEDLSVFDLRKMLSADVSIVKETNLETIYSPLINVSAEFWNAVGSKMLTNLWLDLFQRRAETIVRETIERETEALDNYAQHLDERLLQLENRVAEYSNQVVLPTRKARLASEWIALTGVAPKQMDIQRLQEDYDFENPDEPYRSQRLDEVDLYSFTYTPHYEEAMLPRLMEERNTIGELEQQLDRTADPALKKALENQLEEHYAFEDAYQARVADVEQEIESRWKQIRSDQVQLDVLQVERERIMAAIDQVEPLLAEAGLLRSGGEDRQYADLSITRAITPDQRVFPRRSLMTALGMVIGFVFFCLIAVARTFWHRITEPET